jgi:glycosyltransferase involved in cell wall biosynthesis
VQTNTERAGAHDCDMDLRILGGGPVLRINQRLGEGSRGCRLDPGALEAAVAEVALRMEGAEALVLNKFGKHESEGRGFRLLIAEALAAGLTVVLGVNRMNLEAFRAFTGGAGEEIAATPEAVAAFLNPRAS